MDPGHDVVPSGSEADQPPFLTRGEAARLLHLSPERVRQLTLNGRLPFHPTPLGRLYAREDLQRFLAERDAPSRKLAPGVGGARPSLGAGCRTGTAASGPSRR